MKLVTDPGPTALGTDHIFLATSALADDTGLRDAVLRELRAIVASAAYLDWSAGLAQLQPFEPGGALRGGALSQVGLLRDRRLCVRVNTVERELLLTDGVWVDARLRVFPFPDESAAIHRYCLARNLVADADAVIDLATGSGHNLAHFAPETPSFGMDINPRALAFFGLNQRLNGRRAGVACLNDIRRGFADIVPFPEARRPLVLGNMPFGLAPTREMLALTSDGGETGLALQRHAFEAVARFRQTPCGRRARVVMLGYSVGNATEGSWEMVKLARDIVGAEGLRWEILAGEGLVRVDGQRIMANPAPLSPALQAAGGCGLYHRDPTAVRAIYAELAERLEARGMPDLSYLVVELAPTDQGGLE
ncbi:MAG: hypothetical protein H0W47_17000 [Polaromonas sp.]|uniref:hypothetical protein n=1 Tax=Polaromonas sp. TaxID=1869339 RepID=UPI00185B0B0E|nr:hypothetical protein [Polaromonas sp.]MBA3595466.1 hypothetical protein [Polaromonas sp.]